GAPVWAARDRCDASAGASDVPRPVRATAGRAGCISPPVSGRPPYDEYGELGCIRSALSRHVQQHVSFLVHKALTRLDRTLTRAADRWPPVLLRPAETRGGRKQKNLAGW